MKLTVVRAVVVCIALILFETPKVYALQSGQNGMSLPCGARGTLFANVGTQPTDFDLGADWSGSCRLTLAWDDADGRPQAIILETPPFPGVSSNPPEPSGGASSSLAPGGAISWATQLGTNGPNLLNVRFQRAPSSLSGSPKGSSSPGTATFGSVGGKFGPLQLGQNIGENLSCGSSGTLYTNLTSAPIPFDLMLNNESPYEVVNNTNSACSVAVSWTDGTGHPQAIFVAGGLSQGASATTLPPGGAVSWSSSGDSSLQVAVEWQIQRAVPMVR